MCRNVINHAMKTVRVGNRRLALVGVSDGDRYFSRLVDGIEDGFARICRCALCRDDVALDVGANIGITSAILSETVASVHALEAAPNIFRLLETNIAGNGLHNVTLHNLAISDRVGHVRFIEDSAYGYVNTGLEGRDVSCVSIDELVTRLGLERVDFIKVDIEGGDWTALKGAAQTIANFHPLIYMEFNPWCLGRHAGVNPIDFARWIIANFAFIYFVSSAGIPKRLGSEQMLAFTHDNIRKMHVPNFLLATEATRIEAVSRLESELQHLYLARRQLANVRNSASWRLTAPLRTIKRRLMLGN
jgi:FkbM family methyltransferase